MTPSVFAQVVKAQIAWQAAPVAALNPTHFNLLSAELDALARDATINRRQLAEAKAEAEAEAEVAEPEAEGVSLAQRHPMDSLPPVERASAACDKAARGRTHVVPSGRRCRACRACA